MAQSSPLSPHQIQGSTRPPGTFSVLRARTGRLASEPAVTYRIADRLITLQQFLPKLELFRCPESSAGEPVPPRVPAKTPFSFDRSVHLAGAGRTVECTWTHAGCRLSIPDLGEIQIDGSGRFIAWTPRSGSTVAELQSLQDAVVEAGLVLALALQGVWCLRAGSVARSAADLPDGAEAIGFVSDAGGSSALATSLARMSLESRHPGGRPGPRLRLASDDILPWTLAPTPRALPRYPQLRYPANRQPASLVAKDLPLAELYCLAPYVSDPGSEPASELEEPPETIRLDPQEGLLELIRHTACSTLFSQSLLARHFDDCTLAARWLQVFRLRYPASGRADSR